MMMRERARQWLRPLMLALCVEGRGCAFASTVCGLRMDLSFPGFYQAPSRWKGREGRSYALV